MNRAGSIMTGFEADQVLNREFIEHVAVQDTERCLYHFRSLISGKTREVSDRITYQRADGVERVFELACRAMNDEAENYNGIAGTLTDITAVKPSRASSPDALVSVLPPFLVLLRPSLTM